MLDRKTVDTVDSAQHHVHRVHLRSMDAPTCDYPHASAKGIEAKSAQAREERPSAYLQRIAR